MPGKTEKMEATGVFDRLRELKEDKRCDIEVEVERVFPETDERDYPISGWCCNIAGNLLTKALLINKVGGGTYRLKAIWLTTGRFFGQETIKLPGIPLPAFPGKETQAPKVAKAVIPTEPYAPDTATAVLMERMANQIENLAKEINQVKLGGNGNGHKTDNSEILFKALESIGKLKGVLGLDKNESLGVMQLIQLMRESENRGEKLATKIFELSKGGDGNASEQAELELAKSFGDLIRKAPLKNQVARGQATTQSAAGAADKAAAGTFMQMRDMIADTLEAELGEFGKTPALAIRGSRTPQELQLAIAETCKGIADYMYDDEDDGEPKEENAKPGDTKSE